VAGSGGNLNADITGSAHACNAESAIKGVRERCVSQGGVSGTCTFVW
jgi:hypothetical protein